MWGDPYGGWAFGPRYLIPAMAALAVCLPFARPVFSGRRLWYWLFILALAYSAWVSVLGAVTTTANPPKFEIDAVADEYGWSKHYNFVRNWEYLQENGSRSFVYNFFGQKYMSAEIYFYILFAAAFLLAYVNLARGRDEKFFVSTGCKDEDCKDEKTFK
jgi:hypothetical protein